MIENTCALVKLKSLKDNSQDFIFGDPPYALGSTVYIDKDGKPKYKLAKDFMSKWEMPDHVYWEEFFKVAEQKLKFGGRILFFGIDRQLFLFQYYAVAAGFEIKQSLYWYFISNFPKATDLSKQIDKRLGVDREETGIAGKSGSKRNCMSGDFEGGEYKSTESNTELGKKYEGYKYSISPLKQVLETVMVFQKRTKNKSILDDVFAFENGDKTISPSIWAIDEGRVPINDEQAKNNFHQNRKNVKEYELNNGTTYDSGHKTVSTAEHVDGRYPSQMFIDSTCASKIDEQSGELTSGKMKAGTQYGKGKNQNTYGALSGETKTDTHGDTGGASRILHHIGYLDEELDLVFYSPKVSTFEREHGCGDLERKNNMRVNAPRENEETKTSSVSGNSHPTLKPIKLIYQIAKLLKAPFPQNVFFPFSGAGSEIIGFEQAGFDKELFEMSELDTDFCKIAETRRKAWRGMDINNLDENKKHIEKRSKEHKKQESLF